ncbi:phage holin family protein [Actinoplanes bogorensis]|uniref:Phage holin family protein n=1 Tax=Paractinoplanes bogorensis TaxID=1610840 RepID=A0ABS5Z050_9ACTN|nr:phage holin family protein [Actinoplanes bogorensis]MBU2668736.1 phage holin family protein [Actinoplanes bogorensis]
MKPHRMDGVSLSFGVLFLLVAVWWAVSRVVTVHLPAVGWLVAGGLIVFGVIGLLGALRSARSTSEQKPVPAVAEQPAGPELPGDLTPEVHASIVQELLDDSVERITKEHPDLKPEQPRKE